MQLASIPRLVMAALLLAALVGCAAHKQEAVPSKPVLSDKEIITRLAGPVWVAEYIHGKPVIDMSHSSMVFTGDGIVSGRGGCNSYRGTYKMQGGKLSFGPIASTMMMCGPAVGDQEMRFFQSLGQPQAVEFENGLLRLVPEEGEASVFAPHEME
ncbi:META domain-containing protein [Pseudodesulfovibrio sp. zrk46]|uniref:META domain-containing protein n=1 Tax=Pseudodesulfovibrio sp. zrk46 TaxID=2725288 RepID=UPI0014499CB8|nr:META domain-containing protein [Pseudodesulfovibrio sp. zrk46]QJB55174.1 META domain-containing protein [Pseudodesulfovibrio sp. zrk46]